jgi:hypothetical protein
MLSGMVPSMLVPAMLNSVRPCDDLQTRQGTLSFDAVCDAVGSWCRR